MYDKFKQWCEMYYAYEYFLNHSSWDAETEAPNGSMEYRAKMVGILSGMHFDHMTSTDTLKMFNELLSYRSLSNLQVREIERIKKEIDKVVKIPKDRYLAYQELLVRSQQAWEQAFHDNDYVSFKPFLQELISFNREFVSYYDLDDLPYNILLDEYEEGMTIELYDKFFDQLKSDYVPFVREYLENKKRKSFDFADVLYDVSHQKEFVTYLSELFLFDFDRGVIKESVHPFTWHTHSSDVRYTVRYHENLFASSIFSAAHELGHAIYEQNIDSKYDGTSFSGGTSLGIHESQSRFFENHVARSEIFWENHLIKLKEKFPQLQSVSSREFYEFVNDAKASFIRVEADELTYPLHIMVRYEIEKGLFDGSIDLEKLPEVWNDKYEEYLGIRPSTDSEGILQDVHWSAGLFGYFPTYALGSAISAQLVAYLQKNEYFDEKLASDDFKAIIEWLKEHIHHYGGSLSPSDLLKQAIGQELDVTYYIEYLKNKYLRIG